MRILPNLLSVVRALLTLPVVLLIRAGADGEALLLLLAAAATDGLDGWLARRWNVSSELGRVLDPMADKILAAGVAVALWRWSALPGWFLLVVLARDLLILAGSAVLVRRTGLVPSSNLPGKIAFAVLAAVLIVWLLRLPGLGAPALAAASAFLLFSFLFYVREGARLFRNPLTPGGSR